MGWEKMYIGWIFDGNGRILFVFGWKICQIGWIFNIQDDIPTCHLLQMTKISSNNQ
ncbi:hypothetical protein LCL96_00405 [Rossellomorea aquimaris]|uniref:hypothetical protein n=1 Tax=Rossellomorea aquimaris TaxID=189382 RepID=UPI001CD2C680|nr:hypothetical protein [Rossellomorea aquimaris]MCA1057374.1 hypothetical protein [Rossellomorea aquimaris]